MNGGTGAYIVYNCYCKTNEYIIYNCWLSTSSAKAPEFNLGLNSTEVTHMAYSDGWRKYSDTLDITEKTHMLMTLKNQYLKQLEKQKQKVDKESEKCRLLDAFRETKAKMVKARMKLQVECEVRDRIERKIAIIDGWLNDLLAQLQIQIDQLKNSDL